ncbi:hypothetical protein HA402_006168 [Bradysia odoriphaga]|nr:hypothetical protein HA402_006168 [Bradysia odoriphaga]
MMGAMNMDEIHMETIKAVDSNCPNLQTFYAAGLFTRDKRFNHQILKKFFGRLENIVLQMGCVDGVGVFSDCKKLKEWTQEIFYGFEGECLNFNFPELRSINFSKVDNIDNQHVEPFLSKNPHLKSVTFTRCTIDTEILKLITKHVPAIEEISFNFRRSLVRRSDMQKSLKYLCELEHLKSLNLDCVGAPMAGILKKMAEKSHSMNRVGLFCCPWESKLIEAFASLKDLKSLHLSNITGLTDDCLRQLTGSVAGLTDLTLKYIENITMDGVITLMIGCQRLTTATLLLLRTSTISTARYNMLLEAIKSRPEKIKLTVDLWGSKNPLKLSKDLLKQNLEFLEIRSNEDELNSNTSFDFYCDSVDGGYDLVCYSPSHFLGGRQAPGGPQSCNVN